MFRLSIERKKCGCMREPPSYLDSPRFADDEPLSVWRSFGPDSSEPSVEGVAPAHAFGNTVRVRKEFEEWDSPSDAPQDKPIAIELVRGLNGVGDETWSVLVDGKLQQVADGDPHWLPPPFSTDMDYDEDTRVRPVIFAMRLESEALEPARVELVIEQVERSSARADETLTNVDRSQDIRSIAITPYRTRDPTASAVQTPYPFHAPIQSSIGLISFNDQQKAVKKAEVQKNLKNMREIKNTSRLLNSLFKTANPVPGETPSTPIKADDFKKILENPRHEFSKWRKLLQRDKLDLSNDDSVNIFAEKIREYIIGGGTETAPHALSFFFDRIRLACEEVGDITKEFDKNLEVIRNYLIGSEKPACVALLDGLATDSLYDMKEAEKKLDEERKKAAEKQDDERKKAMASAQKSYDEKMEEITKKEEKDNNTEFVFDAIPIYMRLNATTRFVFRIEIEEHSGEQSKYKFESNRDYGAAAHAVYSCIDDDLKKFEESAEKLKVCLLKSVETVQEPKPWLNWLKSYISDDPNKRMYQGVEATRVTETINYISQAMKDVRPAWPPEESLYGLESVRSAQNNESVDTTVLTNLGIQLNDLEPVKVDTLMENLEDKIKFGVEDAESQKETISKSRVVRELQMIVHTKSIPITAKPSLDNSDTDINNITKTVEYGKVSRFYRLGYGLAAALTIFAITAGLDLLVSKIATLLIQPVVPDTIMGWFQAIPDFFKSYNPQNIINSYTGGYSIFDKSLATGVAQGYQYSNTVVQNMRLKNMTTESRRNAYMKTLRKLFKTPIVSSAENVRAALTKIKEKPGLVSTLNYSKETGQRFRFWQEHDVEIEKTILKSLFTNQDWDLSPYTMAMVLLPPSDVADAAYESQALRNLPVGAASKHITGSMLSKNAPATLSATIALKELQQSVERVYVPPTTIGHMASPSLQTIRQIAQRTSTLLGSVFSAGPNTLHVHGDDPFWQCTPGGSAARLSIRHLPFFQAVDQMVKCAQNTTDAYQIMREFWKPQKRAMIDAFAKEVYSLSQSLGNTTYENVLDKVVDLAQSYSRTRKLSPQNHGYGALAVVSSSAFMLGETWQYRDDVINQILQAENHSDFLKTQHGTQFNSNDETLLGSQTKIIKNKVESFWASRRADMMSIRNIELGKGVDGLVSSISNLDLKDGQSPTHYYCPIGSRMDALPSTTNAFGSLALGNKLVWIDALKKSIHLVKNSLRISTEPRDTPATKIVPIFKDKQSVIGYENAVGFARHPLVVTSSEGLVRVFLSSVDDTLCTDDSVTPPVSLIKAAGMVFGESPKIGANIRMRVLFARKFAFNTDRLLHAISLAVFTSKLPRIYIEDVDVGHVVSLCLSLALHTTEVGGVFQELYVMLPSEDALTKARTNLDEMMRTCEKSGVTVARLTELSLGLCDLAFS